MHRSRIDAILEPLRSYLRYGHNGPCFVRFGGRLVIKHVKTSRNVVETACRGPCRGSPAIPGARPWDGRAPALAGLGHGRPTWPSSPAGGLGGRPGSVGLLF